MDWITPLLIGVAGSLHCVGMCGPILMALPSGCNSFHLLTSRLIYNFGRISTYMLFGLMAGVLGQFLSLAGWQRSASIIAGVLILVYYFFPVKKLSPSLINTLWTRWLLLLKRLFLQRLSRQTPAASFLSGMLNGFLPCGLVYVAMAGAALSPGWVQSAAYMGLFGLGTLPAMLLTGLAGGVINNQLRTYFQRLIPVFTFTIAVLFILRGLNLGIPYISPALQHAVDAPVCH